MQLVAVALQSRGGVHKFSNSLLSRCTIWHQQRRLDSKTYSNLPVPNWSAN